MTFDHIQRDAEIDGPNIRLYFLSRDRTVLGLVAVVLLALAVGLAWVLRAPEQAAPLPRQPAELLASELGAVQPDARLVLQLLSRLPALPDTLEREIFTSALLPRDKAVANALCASLRTAAGEPSAALLILAHDPAPALAANEMVADAYARQGDVERAQKYYLRELEWHPRDELRARLTALLERHGALQSLALLAVQPEFARHFSARLWLKLALHDGHWLAAARALTAVQVETLHPLPVVLALVAGLAWLLIAVQAGQPRGWLTFRTVGPVIAVLLGLAASWPAHFIAAWQEEVLGLRETGEFLADFAFYVGNVAPREELLKLLFMIPLVPPLFRRGEPLETLIVTGCVGLGFAIERNLQSYQHAGAQDAFGRLLTANFFHLATSGLLGVALCGMLAAPTRRAVGFMGTLLAVTVAHGVYDAFMNIPGLRLLAAASMLSFLIVSQAFFHHLRRWRDHATDQLFLAATLVFSLAVLTGATLVCAATQLGFHSAMRALAANAIGLLLVVIVFFRKLSRGLGVP